MSDLLTPHEVASRLRVTVGTLAKWRTVSPRLDLPFVKISSHAVRYEAAVVEGFLEKNRRSGPDGAA